MATFVPGTGALGLQANINTIAFDNGCSNYSTTTGYSLYQEWNLNYIFAPEFNAPYNMGFFYGQGCPGNLRININFYADPYNESLASYGLYVKVGTTGTEYLIATLDAFGTRCDTTDANFSTKGGIGQSGNTVYVGVRFSGKSATPIQYDAVEYAGFDNCPDTNNGDWCGTYDYPGSGAAFGVNVYSALITYMGMTVNVDKNGYFVTC